MYLDDSACNLASLNLRKFVTAGPGRNRRGARRRRVRRAVVPPRGGDDHPGAGDHRRERQVPDAQDRRELAAVPAAGPRLRQPGRAAHVARAAVRQRRGARLRGRHHRAHDRLGLPDQRRHRPRRDRSVRRLRREPRAVHRRHEEAPQGGRQDRQHGGAGRHDGGRARRLGSDAGHRQGARLPQRPGHGAGADGDHRLHDGLRHHRHRAGHRAHQVQAAGRRRDDQDRQQHDHRGAGPSRLRRRAGQGASSSTSTPRRRSRARPASSRSTCRSSTAPSARRTAPARSTTRGTSG